MPFFTLGSTWNKDSLHPAAIIFHDQYLPTVSIQSPPKELSNVASPAVRVTLP